MDMCMQWCQSEAWVIGFRGSALHPRQDWWFRFRLLAVVWQTFLGISWNWLNHVYILNHTPPTHTPPPKNKQQQHKFMNQMWNSEVTWCASQSNRLVCREKLSSVSMSVSHEQTSTLTHCMHSSGALPDTHPLESSGWLQLQSARHFPISQDISHNRSAEHVLTLSISQCTNRGTVRGAEN